MTGRAITALIILLLLLGLGGYFFLRKDAPLDTNTSGTYNPDTNNPGTSTSTPATQNALIRVTAPLSGATIESPVTVKGEARGNWYFEASFPIEVLDANGKRLGMGIGQAQGEWMTENFSPFTASIEFSVPTTPTGTIVLHKDNPSDMRELDDELRMPVRFANVGQP